MSPGFCLHAQELTSTHTCAYSTQIPHTHTIYFFFSLSININFFFLRIQGILISEDTTQAYSQISLVKKQWDALKLKAGLFVRSNFTCDTHL